MAKIKLTKNELKKQKDALKRFNRYLPTLVLKKQQLQTEIRKIEADLARKQEELAGVESQLDRWVDVLAGGFELRDYLAIREIKQSIANIAGIDIPVFEGVDFIDKDYNLFTTPLWVDKALIVLKQIIELLVHRIILQRQVDLLGEELRITTQRVNLFEKVKIPQAKEGIRKILVFLGDQQTAAVVRGKISKFKLVNAR